jgi:modulator of FtsH protease HflC
MNRNLLIGLGVAAVAAVVLLFSSLFMVHQTQQAIVVQFGNPKRVIQEPGLHAKIPFIQNVLYVDRRVLDFDAPDVELILGDRKRLVVNSFARYRITDPLRFYQSVRTEAGLRGQFQPILNASLRNILGEVPLFTVLSADRRELMTRLSTQANTAMRQYGVEIVDVRIMRADLPAETNQAIYRRMQTEREREAAELRAQGAELAQRIRSRADRERRVIIAEAERQANIDRGLGDAEATAVFAQSFGRDIDFYTFYRTMEAYKRAFRDGATSFVLSPSSEFFQFFHQVGLVERLVPPNGAPAVVGSSAAGSAPVVEPAGSVAATGAAAGTATE